MSYDPRQSPSYPEPFRGEPVQLPIERDGDPPRVLIHTELGVPIYFAPETGQFGAQISGVAGRGAGSELRSADFFAVVARIRERALVVPVEGYLLVVDEWARTEDALVRVHPCTVIEHHPRRGLPYVIRISERDDSPLRFPPDDPRARVVQRIRTVERVHLPEPEQLARVRAATGAIRAEHARHRAEVDRLQREQTEAIGAIRVLGPDDLVAVQAGSPQPAADAGELGAVIYEAIVEEEDNG